MGQRIASRVTVILVAVLGIMLGVASPTWAQDGPDESGETSAAASDNETETPVDIDDMLRNERVEVRESTTPVRSMFPYDEPGEHWMWVVGRNAVWGGMLGGLIGVGVYLVTGMEYSPWIISQFAGGGILVGAATGLIEAAFWSSGFVSQKSASVDWISNDAPRTYDIRVVHFQF